MDRSAPMTQWLDVRQWGDSDTSVDSYLNIDAISIYTPNTWEYRSKDRLMRQMIIQKNTTVEIVSLSALASITSNTLWIASEQVYNVVPPYSCNQSFPRSFFFAFHHDTPWHQAVTLTPTLALLTLLPPVNIALVNPYANSFQMMFLVDLQRELQSVSCTFLDILKHHWLIFFTHFISTFSTSMLQQNTIDHWFHYTTPAARQRVMCMVFIQQYRNECSLGWELKFGVDINAVIARIGQQVAQDVKNKLVRLLRAVFWYKLL